MSQATRQGDDSLDPVIPTGDTHPDVVALLNDEPIAPQERLTSDPSGTGLGLTRNEDIESEVSLVVCPTLIKCEPVTVRITYDATTVHSVVVSWTKTSLEAEITESDEQPENGKAFDLLSLGFDIRIELLPVTEVNSDAA